MKQFICLFSIISMAFFSSCGNSNNLSREKAKDLIIATHNLPSYKTEGIHLKIKANCSVMDQNGNIIEDEFCASNKKNYELLRDKGLITYSESTTEKDGTYLNILLTPEAEKYLVETKKDTGQYSSPLNDAYIVKTLMFEFGEITGIKMNEQQKTADVDFTIKRTGSPFAYDKETKLINEHATFSLYDDGWRIISK